MTRIRARYGKDGYSVVSVGHATASAEACAGVSAILYALAGWLRNSGVRHGASLEPGDALIWFDAGPGAEAVMDMTVIGLAQIAEKYPESVTVETVGGAYDGADA